MDAAKPVEELGIAALEIHRNHGKAGILHQFDNTVSPGDILDDTALTKRRTILFLLPGADLPGREQGQQMTAGQMLQSGAKAIQAAGRSSGEIVHRDETVRESGNQGQHESRQNLEVRTTGSDEGFENQAVETAVRMVADDNECALGRNPVQLMLRDVIPHSDLIQDGSGKGCAGKTAVFLLDAVEAVQIQGTVEATGRNTTGKTLDSQQVLQFGAVQYVRSRIFHSRFYISAQGEVVDRLVIIPITQVKG